MKKLVLLMALVCLVMVGVNKPADAALDWQSVSVVAAGSGGGFAWCGLKFNTTAGTPITKTYRFYFATGAEQNQLLATAMTAMSNGGAAEAYFDPDTQTNYGFLQYLSADSTKTFTPIP